MVVIFWPIDSGRSGECDWHVREQGCGCRAVLECEQISKGLEGRARGTCRPGSIHLTVGGREIIFRANERDHVAGPIFDHHYRAVSDFVIAQSNEMMLKGTAAEIVQFEIECGSQFAPAFQPTFLPNEIDKMRCIEIRWMQ